MECACAHCGQSFRVAPYRATTATYCSRRCLALAKLPAIENARLAAIRGKRAHNAGGASVECARCGVTFAVPPSRVGLKRYCSQACYSAAQRTDDHRPYKRITVDGRRVLEHRWVMEQHLGRSLLPDEQVDHINRRTRDNWIENLRVLTIREHGAISSSHRGTSRPRVEQ